MIKIFRVLTIGIFFLSLLLTPFSLGDVNAAVTCPKDMSDMECYNYLNKKLTDLEKNQGSLQSKLKNEDYQQLSLQEKINYINGQVSQTEKVIDTLEVEIASNDVEIKLLTKEIQIQEDNLSTLNQEILLLEDTVNKRITESYKYSFVGALEIFLDTKNFDTVIRKTKYLLETRQKDKEALAEFSTKSYNLEVEEVKLAEKRATLQKKRNDIETEKTTLVEERNYLDQQKAEKDRLLAESQRREKEYRAQLAAATAAISETDEMISDLVIKLFNSGGLGNGTTVTAGQTIGYQGHTGCSFGSHLHFDIRNRYDTRLDPKSYLNGGTVWSSVTSKVYGSPLDGAVLTQAYKSTHRAWDMYSSTRGIQNGSTYKVPSGICTIVDYYIKTWNRDYAYLTGEGAPVKAVSSGKVYYGSIIPNGPNGSKYPAKYALVVHNDGNKSFYLHLR